MVPAGMDSFVAARSPRGLPPLARAALTFAAVAATIAFSYAALRVFQKVWFPEPDPRTVIWSPKIAMFWRLWIGAYLAGPISLGTWGALGRWPEGAAAWVARGIVVAGVAIALQGLFVP
jgi:hypothetical protein